MKKEINQVLYLVHFFGYMILAHLSVLEKNNFFTYIFIGFAIWFFIAYLFEISK